MSPEDIRKLLGGYATGTLTTEEQQALFAAALEDQELFDELAREQSLRDLLRDPAARAELLGALDTPAGRPGGFWQWPRRPMVAGLAAAGVAAVAIVAVWQGTRVVSVKPRTEPVMVAELKRPDAVTTPSTPQPPAPANQPESSARDRGAGTPAAVKVDKKTAPAMALRVPSVRTRHCVPECRIRRRADEGEASGDRDGAVPVPGPPNGGRHAGWDRSGPRRTGGGQESDGRDGAASASTRGPRSHACLDGE